MVAARRSNGYAHGLLGDPTESADPRRGERRGVRGVRLLDEAGGVDLIVEHDDGAEPPGRPARRHAHGGEQVRRPVRPRQGRVAHGTGNHDGLVPLYEQVEEKGRLLDAVRPLRDDDTRGSPVEAALYLLRESYYVVYRELGAGYLAERGGRNFCNFGYLRDGLDQLFAGQLRRHAGALRLRRGDRTAQGEYRYGGKGQLGSCFRGCSNRPSLTATAPAFKGPLVGGSLLSGNSFG